jgi:hypothetical protein
LNKNYDPFSQDAMPDGPLDYHDEFMSKLDEFSLSWRNAAMNERN